MAFLPSRRHLDRLCELATVLEQDPEWLARRITSNLEREFVFLQRHVSPGKAEQVLALGLPGIGTVREYRRYYPASEVTGHLIGFADVDDRGQEGLEAAETVAARLEVPLVVLYNFPDADGYGTGYEQLLHRNLERLDAGWEAR